MCRWGFQNLASSAGAKILYTLPGKHVQRIWSETRAKFRREVGALGLSFPKLLAHKICPRNRVLLFLIDFQTQVFRNPNTLFFTSVSRCFYVTKMRARNSFIAWWIVNEFQKNSWKATAHVTFVTVVFIYRCECHKAMLFFSRRIQWCDRLQNSSERKKEIAAKLSQHRFITTLFWTLLHLTSYLVLVELKSMMAVTKIKVCLGIIQELSHLSSCNRRVVICSS